MTPLHRVVWRMLLSAALLGGAGLLPAQEGREARPWLAPLEKAETLRKEGKYKEAVPLYEKALELVPKEHVDLALVLNQFAVCNESMGDLVKAEAYYLRSIQIYAKKLGADSVHEAQVLHNLGALYVAKEEFDKAEAPYRRSLAIREAKLGKDDLNVAKTHYHLGTLYFTTGHPEKAEPFWRRSLAIREAKLGKDNLATIDAQTSLAGNCWRMGQFTEAKQLFERSLAAEERLHGKDHPRVAEMLTSVGAQHEALGDYAQARALYLRSISTLERHQSTNARTLAVALNNLGLVYNRLGEYPKAEQALLRCLKIYEGLPANTTDVARTLQNLSQHYALTNNLDKALDFGLRSQKAWGSGSVSSHYSMGTSLGSLSELYVRRGELDKAEEAINRSIQIERQALGKVHPFLVGALSNKGAIHIRQQRWADAAVAFDEARRMDHRYLTEILPTLSDAQQLQFLYERYQPYYMTALSLSLLRPDAAEFQARSAEWLLNGKGVAQQALAQTMLLTRDSADAGNDRRVQELLAVRSQLARLALTIPKPGQEESHQKQCDQLGDRERALVNALGLAGVRIARPRAWTELATVRAGLAADSVLVEVARFAPLDFQTVGRRRPERYVAWIISAKADVQLVDLGPAGPIDEAVQAACERLAEASKHIREAGEADAEKNLRPALANLSRLVLQPLRKHIGRTPHWYISPDGNLWRIPWAALLLDDDQYVVEKHTLTYLISGRDLLTPIASVKRRDPPLMMADPDFDLDVAAARAEADKLSVQPTQVAALRGIGAPGQVPLRVERLPGTAAEAQVARPLLEKYTGEKPWLYRGRQALESVFKTFHSPKVVVLSTHGYFLDSQNEETNEERRPPQNPLLRCGLLLAGCNNRDKVQDGGDDGVLTGLEILGCDLRGTELVVLSACETGLGQVRAGEGVAGLRQAFQLAGAQAVVASLWQVPDRDTAFLMSDFFAGLASGKNKAEALRMAQLARIKSHRERDGAAHPFFWAAFTLTDTGK